MKASSGISTTTKAKQSFIQRCGPIVVWGDTLFQATSSTLFSVEGNGGPHSLHIMERDEDNVGQLFRYKKMYLFNQGQVLDVPYSSCDEGVHIGTYGRHGGDNQQWHITQAE